MKKILLIFFSTILVVTGLYFAFKGYSGYSYGRFTKQQVGLLNEYQYISLYNNLAPDLRAKFEDAGDFSLKFSSNITIYENTINKVESEGSLGKPATYRYTLVRTDDPLKGYTIAVTTTNNPFSPKMKDIVFQEEVFDQIPTAN